MPILPASTITRLLKPYLEQVPETLVEKLSLYLDLLMKWNARTNLTAIREPEEIVRRHFGESLFTGAHLPEAATLLDFGSGAGFPGLPIQILRPDLTVTLAESQNKKATFLREVVRTLGLRTEVWSARVEAMPVSRQFDLVTLRAVDNMSVALAAAQLRAVRHLAVLTTASQALPMISGFSLAERLSLPEADDQQLLVISRVQP